MENDKEYLRAKKKVGNLKDFYRHLTIYMFVNILLFAINFFTFQGDWWFVYPLGGWGIGLVIHGLTTYVNNNPSKSDWEEKKIKEYIERDKKNN